MLQTLGKVAAELAVSGVMHADHRALSLASIAYLAGDARYVAQACQSRTDTGLRSDRADSVADRCPGGRPAGQRSGTGPVRRSRGRPSARPAHGIQRGVAAKGPC